MRSNKKAIKISISDSVNVYSNTHQATNINTEKEYVQTKMGLIPNDWKFIESKNIFENCSQKNNTEEELLSATQDKGIIPRSLLETRVTMPEGSTSNYKLVEKGNFVISLRSFQGGLEYSNYRGIVSPAYTILKNKIDINPYFYKYLFKTKDFISNLNVAVIGIRDGKQISYKEFAKIKIPLPPISEQKKIVEIIETWDKAISLKEDLIKEKIEQKKYLMQDLLIGKKRFNEFIKSSKYKQAKLTLIPVDWEEKTIFNLIKFVGGSQPPRTEFISKPREGYIRLIQIRDYKTNNYATYIPQKLARRFCDKNDIMIGRYGPPIFQILKGLEGAYNVALIKAIPNESLNQNYMYYFLKQDKLFLFVESLSRRTSGQTGIDMDQLNDYLLPLPKIEEQKKIASVLSTCDQEIDLLQQELDSLKEQKKGLMQLLLTGKVRVNINN